MLACCDQLVAHWVVARQILSNWQVNFLVAILHQIATLKKSLVGTHDSLLKKREERK